MKAFGERGLVEVGENFEKREVKDCRDGNNNEDSEEEFHL